jgi:hypothetical protein
VLYTLLLSRVLEEGGQSSIDIRKVSEVILLLQVGSSAGPSVMHLTIDPVGILRSKGFRAELVHHLLEL